MYGRYEVILVERMNEGRLYPEGGESRGRLCFKDKGPMMEGRHSELRSVCH